MDSCENLEKCGFVVKYLDTKSHAVKGFIAMYCKGDMQEGCKRKQYKKVHGVAPSDDMLPNGLMISNN
jgi:hypothetical protein